MKKAIKLAVFLLVSLFLLSACESSSNDKDNSLYVLTEISSNRGNTGYKKGDVISYSIDLNGDLVHVNEFTEDGVESELKENNTYDLEKLEETEEKLSFSFDNRNETLLKKSDSFYESEVTGIEYQFQKGKRH